MGVLSSLLEYKSRKEAQQNADLNAIPQAMLMFEQARQAKAKQNLEAMATLGTLATKGIKPVDYENVTKGFVRDNSLLDPSEQLIQLGQVADAQMKIAQLTGGIPSVQPTAIPGTPQATQQQTTVQDLIPTKYNALRVPTEYISKSSTAQEEATKTSAKRTAELAENKKALKKQLEGVLALESTIPRSEEGGVKRFAQGIKNYISGKLETGPIGQNIKTYADEVNRITPLIARTSGDVANIAVTERAMSKGIFASLAATKGVSARKRALLTDLTNAVDAEDGKTIKSLLDEQNIPYYDLTKKAWVNLGETKIPTFATLEEAENADIPIGAEVIVAGKKMRKQ